jgi:hypothetical protein
MTAFLAGSVDSKLITLALAETELDRAHDAMLVRHGRAANVEKSGSVSGSKSDRATAL